MSKKFYIYNEDISISPLPPSHICHCLYKLHLIYHHPSEKYFISTGYSPAKFYGKDKQWNYTSVKEYDEWLENHLFSKEEALEIAAREVQLLVYNGKTYKDFEKVKS